MIVTAASATYFNNPFEQALEIIAAAGFEFVELDLFWERKHWAMAQHLRGYAPRDVVRLIERSGLKVGSIHDGGGVLDEPGSIRGYVNPQLNVYLDCLGYAPECIVFHTPHVEASLDGAWWQVFSGRVIAALHTFRGACRSVTIENMHGSEGYTVPLLTPEELAEFACLAGIGVTLDTSHYAEMGVDITAAARVLSGRVHSVHLSDSIDNERHVFLGDGALDFPTFFHALDLNALRAITLECSGARRGERIADLATPALVERLKLAKSRLDALLFPLHQPLL